MIRELPTHPVYAPVQTLLLYLTEDCNLRCSYCFVPKKARSMSRETARQAVDFLLHRDVSGNLPAVEIAFFGGEPFMRVDLMEEIVAYARSRCGARKVTFAATTNATLFSPRIQRLIEDTRMRLLLSLDGDAKASLARPFLSGRPSYPLVARNLPRLVACASWSSARMTFHPGSLDLVGCVRHLLELGAPSVSMIPVVEADWRGSLERLERAYQELGDWFLAECRADRIPPLEITWSALRQWHRVQQGGARHERTCGIATTLFGVTVDGEVLPCHRFLNRRQEALGTVASPKLSPERWKYVHLSSRDILGCEGCVAEPVCGGGCRVLALDAGQGLTGRHPDYCVLTRLHAQLVSRLYSTLRAEGNPAFERGLRSLNAGGTLGKLAVTIH